MPADFWSCSDDFELTTRGVCGAPTLRPSPSLEARLTLKPRVSSAGEPSLRLGVHLHVFYQEEAVCILNLLHQALPSCDLLITTDTSEKKDNIENTLAALKTPPWRGRLQIKIVPNRGRDIIPLLREGLPAFRAHDLILHLHTKRTTHKDFGSDWLAELLDCLLGNRRRTTAIIQAFQNDAELGLLMPQPSEMIRPFVHWGANFEVASLLVHSLWPGRQLNYQAPLVFPPGMMFWARPAALLPLAGATTVLEPLPQEPLLHDGTPLHALERLTAHACEVAGLGWALLPTPKAVRPALPMRRTDASAPRQRLSVWKAQPDAYLAGVACLAQRQRDLEILVEERDRQLKAITDHRNSLEQSIVERDRGLAERDAALEALRHQLLHSATNQQRQLQASLADRDQALEHCRTSLNQFREDILQAIAGERAQLNDRLIERDRNLEERNAKLDAFRRELLQAISEHRDNLKSFLTERAQELAKRDAILQSHLKGFEENQEVLKQQMQSVLNQVDTLLNNDSILLEGREQLLKDQRDQRQQLEMILNRYRSLQESLAEWARGLVERDTELLQSRQELISNQQNQRQQLIAIIEQGKVLETSLVECHTIVRSLEAEQRMLRQSRAWGLVSSLRHLKRRLTLMLSKA